MKDRTAVARIACSALALAALSVACGGRYEERGERAEGGAGGSGGGSPSAGRGGSPALAGIGGRDEAAAGRAGASADCPSPAYWEQRKALQDKASYGCASSSECVAVAPRNSCEKGCSYSAVWYGAADSFEASLSSLANMSCSTCIAGAPPTCEPPPPLVCSNRRCTQ